jgi:hypothetical protein
MPLPTPEKNEKEADFMKRCMPISSKETKDPKQAVAICMSQFRQKKKSKGLLNQADDEYSKKCTSDKTGACWEGYERVPNTKPGEPGSCRKKRTKGSAGTFIYKDPKTGELYNYSRKGFYKKDGRVLVFVRESKAAEGSVEKAWNEEWAEYTEAAEYQGRKVTLNKPFLTPDGPKKRSVYVKNDKGNVVKVNFGDPNMKIKKSDPERRKSFRARHKCDNPGPKWKARYWSCKMW